jgi:hypothetical protein
LLPFLPGTWLKNAFLANYLGEPRGDRPPRRLALLLAAVGQGVLDAMAMLRLVSLESNSRRREVDPE